MKKNFRTGIALLMLSVLVSSCKEQVAENYEEAVEATEAVDTASAAQKSIVSSSAAREDSKSNRKFIRTADIKFKVKDVAKSTYVIEDATSKFGGFVTYTDLKSDILEKDETKVSQDSTLITTKYAVTNEITIRVPNRQLDTVIKTIAKQIDFLDYRIIKADDVSLKLLSNQLAQKRGETSEKRLEKAIDSKGKKLDNVIEAEDKLDAKKENKDQAKLENLSLNDQVNFSTISLSIYQNQTVRQEMIPNEKSINAYRPNIGLQIWDSIKTGWFMLEAIIAFVFQLWGIILLGFLGWFGYKKFLKK
ncbi:DUF4349 domain-containing protein [Flavobacterium sp. H122]|uniref:DUF4349 domain-containing protein n=1 Tax=Flavobacterium sp. H122 TaxID=2529860 RepID=UPI0010AA62AE|nr:DUF4349 domain-containing protein [Flavobacterium sp. H122]